MCIIMADLYCGQGEHIVMSTGIHTKYLTNASPDGNLGTQGTQKYCLLNKVLKSLLQLSMFLASLINLFTESHYLYM